jgi:PAS domain S-box-containing protein
MPEQDADTSATLPRHPRKNPGWLDAPRSFAWHVGTLALGLVLPALILIGLLLWQFTISERSRIESDARSMARTLAMLVGQRITDTTTTLQALATSPSLREGDIGRFYDQVEQLRRQQNQHFSLRNRDGITLLTTRLPFGQQLGRNPPEIIAADAEALARRAPVVSAIFTGPVTRTFNLQIVAPVLSPEGAGLVVGASMDLDLYRQVLERFDLPAEWAATIVDAAGKFIARRPLPAPDIIARPTSEVFRRNATGASGMYYGATSLGVVSLVAFDSVPEAGWRVAVSVPSAIINRSLLNSLLLFGVAGSMLGGLGFWLALVMRRRMGRSVDGLVAVASSIGRDRLMAELPGTVSDIDGVIGALRKASQEIMDSERRLRRVLDNLFAFVGLLDLHGTVLEANQAPLAAAGLVRGDVVGKPFWECYWWNYDEGVQERIRIACEGAAEGRIDRFDIDVRVGEGRFITIDFQIAPLRDENDRIVALQPSGVDITERVKAQEWLALSQTRLQLGVEVAGLGLGMIDYRTDSVTLDARAATLFELPAGGPLPRSAVHGRFHPDENPGIMAAMTRLLADAEGNGFLSLEHRLLLPGGGVRWLSARIQIFFEDAGETRKATSGMLALQDITARKEAEAHRVLLVNELNHRVKNTLATVHSLAAQSFRDADPAIRPQLAAFDERLHALARTHEILTRSHWERADLGEVARYTLSPYRAHKGPDRIIFEGPQVMLSPQQALAISMALHELATNAVKYGALCVPEGHVTLCWTADEMLTIIWREHGGPPVEAPRRKGFGTRLLARALQSEPEGQTEISFRPDGLHYRMSFRITEMWRGEAGAEAEAATDDGAGP